MNENIQGLGYSTGDALALRNKVMRNTYWLLALSMIPTVLGAWLGVSMGFNVAGGMGMLLFFGGAFAFMFAIEKTKNSAAGVPVLLAFTFFMGLMLSRLIAVILGNYANGPQLVMTAFGGTAGIFFVMAVASSVIKRDISGWGKWLFWGAMVVCVGSVISVFFPSLAGFTTICTLAIAIFSAYLLFDMKRVIDGGETNYISATLAIYLDLFNIFQALLSLLGLFGGRRN